MKHYLILRSQWRVSAQDFKNRLLARWPQATLREVANPQRIICMEFEIPMPHSTLEGSLHRDGSCIPFDGEIRDLAEFALWVRSLVPPTERLLFCDESMSRSLDLLPGASPADIFQLYDYTPPPPGWMNYSLLATLEYEGRRASFAISVKQRMTKKRLIRLVMQRWRTERVYEDLKGELGLDHYEGRRFPGWHHHVSVALCCYAFIVAERVRHFPPSARRPSQAQPQFLSA